MVSEEMGFDFFFTNLAFRLPWRPIKFSGLDKIHMLGIKFSSLDKIHMLGRGLLKVHFCKTFVKTAAVR